MPSRALVLPPGEPTEESAGPLLPALAQKDDAVAIHDVGVLGVNSAGIRARRRAAVAHIDEVAFVLQNGDEPAHFARAGGAGAEAGVADFDGNNLCAGREAVQFRLLGEMRGHDAGHVGAVRAAVDDDRKQITIAINVGGEIHLRFAAEGSVIAVHAKIGHEFFIGEIAVLIGVNARIPAFAIVKNKAVENGAGVAVFGLQRFELGESCGKIIALEHLLLRGFGVGFVPIGDGALNSLGAFALLDIPRLAALGLEAAHQFGWENAPRFDHPDAVFFIAALPRLGQRERAAGEAGEFAIFEFAHGGGAHIAAAGAIDDVDDFGATVGGGLQSGRAGIHAGIKNGDDHAAPVVLRMLL